MQQARSPTLQVALSRVDAKERALKRKDLAVCGALVRAAEVVVTPEEYPVLSARAYGAQIATTRAAAKGEPAAAMALLQSQQEMQRRLRANQQSRDDDLVALGNRRARAAKDWLITIGMIAEDRLSLVGAKVGTAADAKGEQNAQARAGSARVAFDLR